LNLFKRFLSRPPGKSRQRRRPRAVSGRSAVKGRPGPGNSRLTWWLGTAVVVVVLGIGLLNWARSRHGQAALLTLGSEKMYGEVQAAVDSVLVQALPGLAGGVADAGSDYDWPAPQLGAGALIRCRTVVVAIGESWWEIQARVAAAVKGVGARVLWGERLLPERLGQLQQRPNEELDLLRLDIGVPGRPTHTLVLVRQGESPRLQWGAGPELSRWKEFAAVDAPTVALIIDDWGHGKTTPAMSILNLPAPLTMAVLPGLSYSRFFSLRGTALVLPPGHLSAAGDDDRVAMARRSRLAAGCCVEVSTGRRRTKLPLKRREIMLHLPMQPQGYPEVNPGPHPVLVGMGKDEIRDILAADLATMPYITGVNNHMGSAASSDEPTMRAFMSVLKNRDLFFVDSLTSSRSVAYAEAVRAGIPAARNRIFLDYEDDNEVAIATNLARLVQSARASGFAVGIGHPHPATAAVLAREIPRLASEGVRFVTMSEFFALREFEAAVSAVDGDD